MQPFSTIAAIMTAIIITAGLILRLLPRYFTPYGAGVDHWFWKSYIEKYRSTGEFPPQLPQFLLDEHQWYPPVFPLLMARLPDAVFERYSHLLAIAIDLVRMIFVMAAVYFFAGRITSTMAAGVVYALTPILITYNIQLNPRGIGALFLDAVIVLLILIIWHGASPWLWGLVALFAGLILLTHKMSTQLFWFLCVAMGVVSLDWRLPLLVPVSMASALLLSGGFYVKVLRAHWDIVTFWNKNWPWLTAHPVRESPLYGTAGFETRTKYYHSGVKGLLRRMQYLIGFNPWGWSLLLAVGWVQIRGSHLTAEDLWTIRWLALIIAFVLLTTFLPALRCLGNGYLYMYNSSFPAALVMGMIWGGQKHDAVVNVILAVTLLLCGIGVLFYLATLRKSKTLKVDNHMNEALERLRELPEGVVICFPQNWLNVISYKALKPVLGGGHGYGFKRLEGIYPRLTRPIKELIDQYEVRYLFTYEGYLPQTLLQDLPEADVERFGQYLLFRFTSQPAQPLPIS